MTTELNKLFANSQTIEIKRSQIVLASYNPRTISAEGRATLKRGIKKFGIIGGIVWNKTTSHLVSGHQKISIADETNKYDGTPEKDYIVKVEAIEVDDKTEKELNILFNNPNAQGEWDYDKLRELIPDIDYKDAGLTDYDLSAIGIEVEAHGIDNIAGEIEELQRPYEERKAAVKEMKQQIKEQAQAKATEHYSHVTLAFDSYANKSAFMLRFGFQPMETMLKGEAFADMIERVE